MPYDTNATLVYREDITPDLAIIRVLPDSGGPDFVPGQYAELSIIEAPREESAPEKLVRKQYSVASAPGDPRGLEFYLALVPQGNLTPKLWRLNPGDRLWLNPVIKGKFTLEEVPRGKDIVAVATGTGIAPFVSMLRAYSADPPWRRFVLVHGARFSCDLGYCDELKQLDKESGTFHYLPIVSREREADWPELRGRVQRIFSEGLYDDMVGARFTPADCQVLLCGNPEMIVEMQQLLQEKGFRPHRKKEPGNIHAERYW